MSKAGHVTFFYAILPAAVAFAASVAQPDALELLKNVRDSYLSMKSFHADVDLRTELKSQGVQSTVDVQMVVTTASPDKIRIENKDQAGGVLIISNGRATWVYVPQLNKYTRSDRPITMLGGNLRETPPFSVLPIRYKDILEGVKSARLLRDEVIRVGGRNVESYVIEIEYEVLASVQPLTSPQHIETRYLPKTLWVEKAGYLVLRESSEIISTFLSSNSSSQVTHTITFNNIKVNEAVPDELFEFNPPAGATETDSNQLLWPEITPRS